jgi:hypothetical protein
MAFSKAPPEKALIDRITEIRAEADAWIDSRAAELKKQHEGLPIQVLRNLLTNRAGGCQCQAVHNILEQG